MVTYPCIRRVVSSLSWFDFVLFGGHLWPKQLDTTGVFSVAGWYCSASRYLVACLTTRPLMACPYTTPVGKLGFYRFMIARRSWDQYLRIKDVKDIVTY
jgi:hypothetical protein